MSDKKPMIIFTRYSPYYAVDVKEIENSNGEKVAVDPVATLCRCGRSAQKPFCDGTHEEKGLNEGKKKDRAPDEVKAYRGKGITILDNRGVCSHDGSCLKMLPGVFDKKQSPWIDPDGADIAQIIETIEACPSGALSFQIGSKRYQDHGSDISIECLKDGPLKIKGGVVLKDDKESTPECREHYTLCRCGGSKNKPFCDGSHLDNGFEDG